MGVDFLETTFIIEKDHGLVFDSSGGGAALVRAEHRQLRTFCGIKNGWDFQAGVFYDCIRNHFYIECSCGKPKRGFLEKPLCPMCGRPLQPMELTWEQFCDAVGQVTGKKRIERLMWLRRDLDFI